MGDYNKEMLHELGFGGKFMVGMFVIDPTGRAIHSVGTLEDKTIIGRTPLYDHQCATECTEEMEEGFDRVSIDINDGILEGLKVKGNTMMVMMIGVFVVVLMGKMWKSAMTVTHKESTKVQNEYGALVN